MAFLLRGILIGVLFGVPAGAVGAMAIQRTLNHGVRAGLATGLGSSAADCIYACIGVFGLTVISDFLLSHQGMIRLLGGGILFVMGIRLLCKAGITPEKNTAPDGRAKMFVSSFAVGITNPAAVLTFLFAFSWFGISGQAGIGQKVLLVCGVFAGTCLWWILLAWGTSRLKHRMNGKILRNINRIFGILFLIVTFLLLSG